MTKSLLSVTVAVFALAGTLIYAPWAGAQGPADPPAAPALQSAASPHVDFYRNNVSHTGYTSDKMPTPLSLLWRHTTTYVKANPASPVFADNTVYFGAGANVYALNAADGTVKWQFPANGGATGNFQATPALAGGALYIGNDNTQLYKLDAATGKQIWASKVSGTIRSSPVVDGGVVYFGSGDNNCYALSTETGRPVWIFASEGAITTSPTISTGQVAFASADNSVYSVNTSTGKKAWSVRLPSDPTASPPVYGDNTLYVGSGPTLYALTARSGNVRWHAKLSGEITTPPTLGAGQVFVAANDNLVYAFSDRGRSLWAAKIDYPTYAAPLVAGDVLIVPTQHGAVYAFNLRDGKLRWEYVVQAVGTEKQPKYSFTDIASAPIFVGNTLYVLSDDGSLSAFRADAPDSIPPVVSMMAPAPGSTVPGARIAYSAHLIDEGSGVDPATVTLTLDGTKLPYAKYDASKNGVAIDTEADTTGASSTTLTDGRHELVLTAKDWRGNAVTQPWGFIVDNRFNPPGSPAPTAGGTYTAPAATTPSPAPPTNSGGNRRQRGRAQPPSGGPNGGGSSTSPPPPPPL